MLISLAELASRIGAVLHGDGATQVFRVASLDRAQSGDLSVLYDRRFRSFLRVTGATAVILGPADVPNCPTAALAAADPYLCYARAAALLHPLPEVVGGVHPTACIDPSSHVDPSAWVGPYTLIEKAAEIGARAFIGPASVIGDGVRIGSDTRLVARVTVLNRVSIGQRCLIYPGAVIGGDGFGFARDAAGWIKVPQLGSVQIGDDVEIGANTTIDRGAMKDTIIGNGVKLDNQIQVAHNVVIGEHTAMAGFVGVSGSTRIGKRCMIGAGVGFGGHLEVADDVVIKGGAAVSKSIRKRGIYASVWPAEEDRLWWKRVARFRQLTRGPAPDAKETDEGDRPEAG